MVRSLSHKDGLTGYFIHCDRNTMAISNRCRFPLCVQFLPRELPARELFNANSYSSTERKLIPIMNRAGYRFRDQYHNLQFTIYRQDTNTLLFFQFRNSPNISLGTVLPEVSKADYEEQYHRCVQCWQGVPPGSAALLPHLVQLVGRSESYK